MIMFKLKYFWVKKYFKQRQGTMLNSPLAPFQQQSINTHMGACKLAEATNPAPLGATRQRCVVQRKKQTLLLIPRLRLISRSIVFLSHRDEE